MTRARLAGRGTVAIRFALAVAMAAGACSRPATPAPVVTADPVPVGGTPRPAARPPRDTAARPATPARPGRDIGTSLIRVLLSSRGTEPLSSAAAWTVTDAADRILARPSAGDPWRLEQDGDRVRLTGPAGRTSTVWVTGPLVLRPGAAPLAVGSRRYRGTLTLHGADTAVVVVNTLPIDTYLRGVVPLEIGARPEREMAAMEAQAITARSYAATHLTTSPARVHDVTATVTDQVYGGVEAERPVTDQAIANTRGMVLRYGGRIVNAPYHAVCGGRTAEAPEVWRSAGEPYLQSVSDAIPGTDRHYCDAAPRFRWTRSFEGAVLDATVARYLGQYARVAGGAPRRVVSVSIASRTGSGRVGTLTVSTDRGNALLRGNDIRYVFRAPSGEILNSTYFSVESDESNGRITRLTLRGAGNGHGIGMCQWGAMGRARAGHDARAILAAYYPGTSVGPLD